MQGLRTRRRHVRLLSWQHLADGSNRTDQKDGFHQMQACVSDQTDRSVNAFGATKDQLLQAIDDTMQRVQQSLARLELHGERMESNILRGLDDSREAQLQRFGQLDAASRMFRSESQKHFDTLYAATHDIQKIISKEAESSDDCVRTRRILESLRFPEIDLRRAEIECAAKDTFEWIFEVRMTVFAGWLKSEDDLFWINGKAGSGKSTLMKFLATHPKTASSLQLWAGDCQLRIVDAYIWFSGTAMQKTEQGLLQTIVRQILQASSSELIREALPKRWAATSGSSTIPDFPPIWEREELSQCLKAIIELARSGKAFEAAHVKYCIFIDGLDEFKGHQLRLLKEILQLSTCPHFKVCVSSRPWNVFVDAYGQLPNRLRLEDFTRGDIKTYVHGELSAYSRGREVDHDLASKIVQKAEGVFFWVFLVVRCVLDGFAEGDTTEILLQRVADLPSNLKDYFRLMIDRVDPIYRPKTMQALKVALLLQDLEPSFEFFCGHSYLYFWLLAHSDPGIETADFALRQDFKDFTACQLEEAFHQTRKYVVAWTKDLLHLPQDPSFDDGGLLAHMETDTTARSSESHGPDAEATQNDRLMVERFDSSRPGFRPIDTFLRQRVSFLHRTVYDFLRTDEVESVIDRSVPEHFREDTFMFQLQLARLAVILRELAKSCRSFRLILSTVLSRPNLDYATVHYCDYLASHYQRTFCGAECECVKSGDRFLGPVLECFIAFRRHEYVKQTLRWGPIWQLYTQPTTLLVAACGWSNIRRFPLSRTDTELLRMLFEAGADANQLAVPTHGVTLTPWTTFWISCRESVREGDDGWVWKIAETFLAHGAYTNGLPTEDFLGVMRYVIVQAAEDQLAESAIGELTRKRPGRVCAQLKALFKQANTNRRDELCSQQQNERSG